jgi:F-type H+-transporting ATPase subunit a
MIDMLDALILGFSALTAVLGLLWRRKIVNQSETDKSVNKRKRAKRSAVLLSTIGLYVFVSKLFEIIFGKPESEEISVQLAVPRVTVLGLNLSTTIVYTWVITAVLILLALILRLTLVPKLRDVPRGAQNVLELAVETASKYTRNTAHGTGEFLASYIFTIALFLVSCACVELLGLRTPASDITLTGALAILTFLFINIYGIKARGFKGRFKLLASPTPVILPVRIITDLAIPVSLACRLFGNMLGGLVVMDLLYSSLGNFAVGPPGLLGLYFGVFHPLIQAFVFITLTLNYINEVTEITEATE